MSRGFDSLATHSNMFFLYFSRYGIVDAGAGVKCFKKILGFVNVGGKEVT